jgi:heterodisulfide reductase subunit A
MAEEEVIKFTIDGQEVEAKPKEVLLDVARRNGINIPTLCYYKAIPGYGSCRLCVVEVTKSNKTKLTASCTYPVEEGIDVKTNSPEVIESRKMLMELLMARCPESEEIMKLAKEIGVEKTRFKPNEDTECKCILCGLCVRVCQDIMGANVLCFANRGANRKVTEPFEEFSEICTTCGACEKVCPTDAIHIPDITKRTPKSIASEHNRAMATRSANYIPFPQAVPNKPVIDREHCMHFLTGECGACEKFCDIKAIDYEQEDTIEEMDVGAIVVATGFDLYNIEDLKEYGGGKYENVIDSLQFERLLSASGPTGGQIRRPSDGKIPKEIVFIQCAGSRDPELGVPYCSKICCMYTPKHAFLYKHVVPDGQAYIFYIDIRASGKSYEEFVQRAVEEEDLIYLRGKVSKVFEEDDKVIVWGVDTLTGKKVEIKADMVVLATAAVPSEGTKEIAKKLRIASDENGWLTEAHPKLRPLETMTAGIFLAGTAQGPKDIPETVSQASGAASKVAAMFSKDELSHDPVIAYVDQEVCVGCGNCVSICAYGAALLDEEKGVSSINEGLCEGCGACAAGCPSGALQHKNYTKKQIFDMVSAYTED